MRADGRYRRRVSTVPAPFAARSGHTLVEVAIALAIVALVCGIAIPAGIALVHGAAVRAATGELVAALALARDRAIAEARPAAVHLDAAAGRALVVIDGDTVRAAALAATHGVTLATSRDSLAYGAGGLGVGLANATVVLSRGASAETVRVSRLGRVRR